MTKHRLLVVDDELSNLEVMARALRGSFDYAAFANSSEALAAVQRGDPFDLALVDQRMPGMSGIELLSRIKRLRPEMARVLVTAYADTEEVVAAINQGEVYRYVLKPFSPPELLIVIKQALERYDMERERSVLLEGMREANRELARVNQSLDARVAERTSDLADALRALEASQVRYTLAVEGANDGLWDWDFESEEVHYSARWKEIAGCADAEVGTSPNEWFDRVHPDDLEQLRQNLQLHLSGRSPYLQGEHRLRVRQGGYIWVLCRGKAILSADGQPRRMAGSITDISRHGVHDRLTGLPNRTLFLDRLESTMHRAKRRGQRYAVLFIDIDRFKVINEGLGTMAGDELLNEVAQRLKVAVRLSDTVAALGGDSFAVLLDDVANITAPMIVVDRVKKMLATPFKIAGRDVSVTGSIGLAINTGRDERPADLLRDAEAAMRQAKERGGDRHAVFDRDLDAQAVARLQLEIELRRAVEQRQFTLHFQPIVSLEAKGFSGVSGVEALIRWTRPGGGPVSPAEFIPVAEESRLIVEIGKWVLEEGVRVALLLGTAAPARPPRLNVNISAAQLRSGNLVEGIVDLLHRAQLEPRRLALEITETAIISDLAASESVLRRLRDLGVRLVLDDFGTGYSSLSYLHRFPVDSLKIDRSFVARLESEDDSTKIVGAIITLAHNLDIKVTAEGVETAGQLELLRGMGCDEAQGYYFAKPAPYEKIVELIRAAN